MAGLWRIGRTPLLAALLLAALVVIPRGVLAYRVHNESSDDDYHLVRGVEFLRRDPGLVLRHLANPVVGEAVGALPVRAMGADTHGPAGDTVLYGQRYGTHAALVATAAWKGVLFLALVAAVFGWARWLYGTAAGWVAAALLVFDPNFAAHGHLAAIDVLSATTVLLALWAGWEGLRRPTRGRLVLAALACAAALLTKHTAVVAPPVLAGYALVMWWGARRSRTIGESATPGPDRVGGSAGGSTVPKGGPWAALLKGALLTPVLMWALLGFEVSAPQGWPAVPGGTYVQSVRVGLTHNTAPPRAGLRGAVRDGGWWYYFPVLATYKVPMGTAAVLALAVASLAWRRGRWEEWSLLLPLAAFAAFLMGQQVNIGWRHALAPYALALVGAGRCLAPGEGRAVAAPGAGGGRGKRSGWALRAVAAAGVLAVAVDFVRWAPDWIGYINFGPLRRQLEINDSNIDWGQGLRQAAAWIDAHPAVVRGRAVYLRPVAVTHRAVRQYVGGRAVHLHEWSERPAGGVLIISPIALTGTTELDDRYGFLRGVEPDAIVGRTLRVYDLDRIKAGGAPAAGARP